MASLSQLTFGHAAVLLLVLCRVGGIVATAPALGAIVLPWRIRVLLTVAIALIAAPACSPATTVSPLSLDFAILAGGELLIGIVLGLGVAILLSAAIMAGQLVSQLSGISLSESILPETGESASPHAQLVYLVALAGYVALGGHRLLIGALMESLRHFPPGTPVSARALSDTVIALVAQSFQLGLRGAAPALAALLVSNIALAVVGRTVPQFGVMSLGLGVNSLIAMAVLLATVGLTMHLVGNQIESMMPAIVQSIAPGDCPNFCGTKMGLSP